MSDGIPVVIKEVWPDCMSVSQVRGIAANGIALTFDQLEQLKREIAEKAYLAGWFSSGDFNPYKKFEAYLNSNEFKQANKKDGEG